MSHPAELIALQQGNRRQPRLGRRCAMFSMLGLTLISGCCCVPSLAAFQLPFPFHRQQPAPPQIVYRPAIQTFASPLLETARPRRVLMVASGFDRGNYGATARVITELATQIRANGSFEVVAPANLRLTSQTDSLIQGKFSEREIAFLSRAHNADAVAVVRVNQLRAVAPMQTSVTMALIDSNETVVIFAVDGVWDTSRAPTFEAFRRHLALQPPGNAGPSDIRLQSPRELLSFAAFEMANAIRGAFR